MEGFDVGKNVDRLRANQHEDHRRILLAMASETRTYEEHVSGYHVRQRANRASRSDRRVPDNSLSVSSISDR